MGVVSLMGVTVVPVLVIVVFLSIMMIRLFIVLSFIDDFMRHFIDDFTWHFTLHFMNVVVVEHGFVNMMFDMVRCVGMMMFDMMFNMVGRMHELRMLISNVWSVGLIQVMVLLGIFRLGVESLVVAVLMRLELLHPLLGRISVSIVVRFGHWVSLLLNRLGRFNWCGRRSSFFHSNIYSNFSINMRSWGRCWSWLCSWLFVASSEVLFVVIFVLGKVMIKIGIATAMVFALPFHFISVWVLDVVIRLRARVKVFLGHLAGLHMTVHVMGSVVGCVPSLFLFIVVFAGGLSFFVGVTENVLIL